MYEHHDPEMAAFLARRAAEERAAEDARAAAGLAAQREALRLAAEQQGRR